MIQNNQSFQKFLRPKGHNISNEKLNIIPDEILKKYSNSPYLSFARTLFKEIPLEDQFIIKCDKERPEYKVRELNPQSANYTTKNGKRDGLDLWTPREYGFGDSAYLFDYLEEFLRDKIVSEFYSIYNAALGAIPLSNCTEMYNPENLEGVTYCQLDKVIRDWRWKTKDTPKDLFQQFDFNFNGVLDAREFILLTIEANKYAFQEQIFTCDHCFELSTKHIKKLYDGIDKYNCPNL